MDDVPPVPTEHAPSVAIAEVVDASETNAFDDIERMDLVGAVDLRCHPHP